MKNIKCRNCFFYRNEWCEKIVDSPDPEEARDCNYFREMTNADRIRAMNDEELAKLMRSMMDCVSCGKMFSFKCDESYEHCLSVCLNWLQMPAEEDDHA